MLRQRVLTALVLAVLVVWGVFALPPTAFSAIVAALMVLGAWEWSRLAGLTRATARLGYVLLVAALIAVFAGVANGSEAAFALLAAALLWWLAALIWVVRFPAGSGVWRRHGLGPALAGCLVLVPTWAALVTIRGSFGPDFLLVLLLLVWGADIGAYFAGRRWGRRKLAPRVSPGKTWEGFLGALGVTAAVMAAATPLLGATPWFIAACLGAVLASVLGDLVESMFKRLVDVKDSSHLLPGHGGILDRIDSVTAAAPVYAAALLVMGADS